MAKQRRLGKRTDGVAELERLAGKDAGRAYENLMLALRAYERGLDLEVKRQLVALKDRYPGASAVRELLGLSLYRLGRYRDAAQELRAFVEIAGSVEHHPILMDCQRAQKHYRSVDKLWNELRERGAAGEVMTEGRIVAAGALADQGNLAEAIRLLDRGPIETKSDRVLEHHVRLWYALADLEERSGNVPRARALFRKVREYDSEYVDVTDRLASLG